MTTNHERRAFLSAIPAAALALSLHRANAEALAEPPTESALLTKLSVLNGLDDSGIMAIANDLYEWHTEVAQVLTNQIKSPQSSREANASAMYFLGNLQVKSAAPLLVENIDFEDPNHALNKRIWMWGRFPAAGALVNLGNSALASIVHGLTTTDDKDRRTMLFETLGGILIYPECTEAFLSKEINKEADPIKQARLQSALAHYKVVVANRPAHYSIIFNGSPLPASKTTAP